MQNMILSDTRVFAFIGGQLCLDFCNTGGDRVDDFVNDNLKTYRGLVSWASQADLLDNEETHTLAALGDQYPDEANAIYERAVTLREALYRTFSAVAGERPVADGDLAILNRELGNGLGHLRLEQSSNGFDWAWASQPDDMDRMLWPVTKSAADLLLAPVREKLHECENDNCSWLFLDESRNHSRRWCTMEDCGNQVKARSYRRRSKQKDE